LATRDPVTTTSSTVAVSCADTTGGAASKKAEIDSPETSLRREIMKKTPAGKA
jgi:hypothetical protein